MVVCGLDVDGGVWPGCGFVDDSVWLGFGWWCVAWMWMVVCGLDVALWMLVCGSGEVGGRVSPVDIIRALKYANVKAYCQLGLCISRRTCT